MEPTILNNRLHEGNGHDASSRKVSAWSMAITSFLYTLNG